MDKQCHYLNYQMMQLEEKEGLRCVILRRNQLKDGFGEKLIDFLRRDKYIKSIDVAGCHMSDYVLQRIVKLALAVNTSLIKFDCRLNPGFTQKLQHNVAVMSIKNIRKLQREGVEIDKKYLDTNLYTGHIDKKLLQQMGLKSPNNKKKLVKIDPTGLKDIKDQLSEFENSIHELDSIISSQVEKQEAPKVQKKFTFMRRGGASSSEPGTPDLVS